LPEAEPCSPPARCGRSSVSAKRSVTAPPARHSPRREIALFAMAANRLDVTVCSPPVRYRKYKRRAPTARAEAGDVLRLAKAGEAREAIAADLGIGVASVYRVLAEARGKRRACAYRAVL
jgi:Helix-turn-helix domain of resolvase